VVVFALIWVVLRLGLITLPALPSGY